MSDNPSSNTFTDEILRGLEIAGEAENRFQRAGRRYVYDKERNRFREPSPSDNPESTLNVDVDDLGWA
ncbi:MAG: hypothetical protein HUU46_07440 [Candidatus Hydrogenedentes bacterium]|nr:hypothetical protein [Candidatus Hydrogenedentota bacterium]